MRAVTLAVLTVLVGATVAHAQARVPPRADDRSGGRSDADEPTDDPAAAEARALFDRGRELAEQRRLSEAAEAFERSLELVARPSTAFNLALCRYALGRHVETIEVLERYRAEADPDEEGEAYEHAGRMLDHARRSVGTLVIDVSPVDAGVTVDGVPIEGGPTRTANVNPGPHVVRVRAPHHREMLVELEVDRGGTVRRAVQLTDARPPAQLSVHVPGRPDARIEVDGRASGRGSARLELEAGEHALRVIHPDMPTHEQTVALDFGERASIVLAEAPASPSMAEDPGLWVGVGVAVLAIAGALAVGFAVAEPSAPDGGSTDVVLLSDSAPRVRFGP